MAVTVVSGYVLYTCVWRWEWGYELGMGLLSMPGFVVSGGGGQYENITRMEFVPQGTAGAVDGYRLSANGGASVRVN